METARLVHPGTSASAAVESDCVVREQANAIAQSVPVGHLVHVDPRTLLAHRRNLRTNLGDLTDLTASIASEGVMQAITVLPEEDGGYRVVAGHRRVASAADALEAGTWPEGHSETVPCLVRPDLVGQPISHILMMLGENGHRAGLTVTEEAAGYAQLAAFNISPEEIARRAAKPVPIVTASLKLHTLNATAKLNANAGTLTLADIHAITEEFGDDPATADRIIGSAASSWGVKHALSEARREKQRAASVAKLVEELAVAGVKRIEKPSGWPRDCRAANVAFLVDADGECLEVEKVRTLDGFGAFIEVAHNMASIVYVCEDPEAHGYSRTCSTNYRTAEQRAEKEAKELARKERAVALDDARKVRQEFLVETWGSPAAANKVFDDALRVAVGRPSSLHAADETLVAALAGASTADAVTAGHDRLVQLLVASWIATEEENLKNLGSHGCTHYRAAPERAVSWFDRLTGHGYALSPIEQQLRDEVVAWLAELAEEDDEGPDVDSDGQDAEGDAADSRDDDAGDAADEVGALEALDGVEHDAPDEVEQDHAASERGEGGEVAAGE